MNEFLLVLIIVIYFLAITLLYKKPKKNYLIAKRRIE